MSNSFRELVDRVRRDVVRTPKRVTKDAWERHALLAEHTDVASMLAVFADDRPRTYPVREALTRVLLTERSESGNSIWASMLIVAYFPMLSRLRHRLVCDTVPRDELDQLVVASFLSAVADLPAREYGDRVAMRLRQRTSRHVYFALSKEYEERHGDEDVDAIEEEVPDERQAHDEDMTDTMLDLRGLLERAEECGISRSGLDAVATTVFGRELLRMYVARVEPNDGAERERLYQCMKRKRTRAMKCLKALIACPLTEPPGSFAP